MIQIEHRLMSAMPGTQRHLVSLHYGPRDTGRKVLIQASLHADEAPAMLVADHLRQQLDELERQQRLTAEVVLVPAANPIGLSQWSLHQHQGRFDEASGENFNRHYPDLVDAALQRLTDPATATVPQIRQALREAAAHLQVGTELEDLRRVLLGLAIDADIVLDLHCDQQAVMHLYTTDALWPQAEALAHHLRAPVTLVAPSSGGNPFDEACSTLWPALSKALGRPLDAHCLAVTVELRGETDVYDLLARQDAQRLIDFLHLRGWLTGPAPETPATDAQAFPLAGSMPISAPHGGVVVFLAEPGAQLRAGETLAEVLDPLSGQRTTLTSPVDGILYARIGRRVVTRGMRLAKVAGTQALRAGDLLSA